MIKVLCGLGLFSTVGLFVAQAPGVPDGFKDWPVTAILGLIALSSISLSAFCMNKVFKAIDTLSSVKDSSVDLASRMNVRPCLLKRDGD